jgi:hypothetical protein
MINESNKHSKAELRILQEQQTNAHRYKHVECKMSTKQKSTSFHKNKSMNNKT